MYEETTAAAVAPRTSHAESAAATNSSPTELTPYIRLDSTDHEHATTQNQFSNYIQKEVNHLKKTGGDTTELSNYLNKVGENPQSFGITSDGL
jgi:hypothetical protein